MRCTRKTLLTGTALLTTTLALSSCFYGDDSPIPPGDVKNVIMMIGDGMGPQQIGLLQEYAERAPNSVYAGHPTALSNFSKRGTVGMSSTGPFGALVVDSACSASQLATGIASGSEMIGLDQNGDPVETVLEIAKSMGKSTGLISDTRITHATPASFAAHQPHRSLENEIAVDMLNTEVDVMLAGGLRHWLPSEVNTDDALKAEITALINEPGMRVRSKRKDSRNLVLEARAKGYELAFNRKQLNQARDGERILGLFADSAMLDGIAYSNSKNDSNRAQPSLREMTLAALDVLSRDPNGFFLMIEGGQIDWAAHANDTGNMLHEMLKFDEAAAAVYEWVKDRQDTLVVITADHETGGFGFSYSRKDLPEPVSLPGEKFVGRDYKPNYNFGRLDILDKLYEQKKSYPAIWNEAIAAAGSEQALTPTIVRDAVNSNSEFKITLADAEDIMAHEPNHYHVPGHPYLDAQEFPKIDDFEEFYPFAEENHWNLIGRKVAADQNVVWGTGTHTHTPVNVIAWGPANVAWKYTRLLHHTNVGDLTIKALRHQIPF